MNRLALVCLILLMAVRPSTSFAIPDDSLWLKMLSAAPAALNSAIIDEFRQWLDSNTSKALPTNPKARLLALLSHTHKKNLMPDAAFNQLAVVVLGENGNPQYVFAQALTDYLLQPETACRQPMFTRYFRQRYGEIYASEACHKPVPFAVLTYDEGMKTVWLDPTRVKSIHLLFGGKGRGIASRFGHVALRLIVCPQGQTSADACDANLSEHLVLGFQAHINEFSLDTVKALSGQYKAYLFANPFMDVYEQYAIGEFREIYSLPLRLDGSRREAMVRELSDIHWRYAGKYSFLGNNCATLLQNALREVWPELAANYATVGRYLRPDHFFNAMRASPLTDSEKLTNMDLAEQKGFYFSSTQPFYERALEVLRSHRLHPDFDSLESYLSVEPIQRRQAMVDNATFVATLTSESYVREAQILLEEYAVLRGERLLRAEAVRFLEEQDMLTRSDSLITRLDSEHARVFNDCLLLPISQQLQPIQRLGGIPDAENIPATSMSSSICQSSKDKVLLQEAIIAVGGQTSVHWQRLNAISRYWSESIDTLSLLKQQALTANQHPILGTSP